jgi:type VI secretion system Hcp family effector
MNRHSASAFRRRIGAVFGGLGFAAALAGPALASSRIYGDLGTIPGESTDTGFVGAIKATGFSVGVNVPVSSTGFGKAQLVPLVITKQVDTATTGLMNAAANGIVLSKVTITVLRTPTGSTTDRIYAKLDLANARVTDWRLSDTTSATQASLGAVEQVTLMAQSYTLSYLADGTKVTSTGTISAQ